MLVASRQALPARPPPPPRPSVPSDAGPGVGPGSMGLSDGHARRHYAWGASGAIRVGPSKIRNAHVAHEGPFRGRARRIAVGYIEWGWRVCGSVFDGEREGDCVG